MAHRAKHLRRNWTPERVANHANQTRGTATTSASTGLAAALRAQRRTMPVLAHLAAGRRA